MCGIVGYVTKEQTLLQIATLKALIKESSIRGLHSFGVSYTIGKDIVTEKQYINTNKLLQNFHMSNSKMLIFHNRYSTSGDWVNEKNNQPIQVDNIAIAMNGVISMATKEEFEKQYNVKCMTDNDTEIFIQKLLQDWKPLELLKQLSIISFAGLILTPDRIIALRNNKRPLYMFKYDGAVFVCSTKDIARRCGIKHVDTVPIFTEVYLNDQL